MLFFNLILINTIELFYFPSMVLSILCSSFFKFIFTTFKCVLISILFDINTNTNKDDDDYYYYYLA